MSKVEIVQMDARAVRKVHEAIKLLRPLQRLERSGEKDLTEADRLRLALRDVKDHLEIVRQHLGPIVRDAAGRAVKVNSGDAQVFGRVAPALSEIGMALDCIATTLHDTEAD